MHPKASSVGPFSVAECCEHPARAAKLSAQLHPVLPFMLCGAAKWSLLQRLPRLGSAISQIRETDSDVAGDSRQLNSHKSTEGSLLFRSC